MPTQIHRYHLAIVAALLAVMVAPLRLQAAADPRPVVSVLVSGPKNAGGIMRRVNGIDWGPDGNIYGTCTMLETVYRINPNNGRVDTVIGPPYGEGDDVAVAPDGSLAWTAIVTGELRYKRPGGRIQILDHDLPGANPVAFRKDGRLVAAQANAGDALYEYDPTGKTPRRLILKGKGDLNSFAFGPDGLLYSPQRPDKVVSINIDTGELKVVGEGFLAPVKPDANGKLLTRRAGTGAIVRLDPATGAVETLVPTTFGVDSMAIGKDGTVYVSNPAQSRIYAVNPKTGAIHDVVSGHFSSLGGLAIAKVDGKEILEAADNWGYRNIDVSTGEVTKPDASNLGLGGSSDLSVSATKIAFTNVRTGQVQIVDRTTNKVLKESKDIKQPYGVAFLDDGAVAVADFIGKRLARVDDKGITTLADGFEGPVGIARDKDGTLLVSDARAGTIRRVNPTDGKSAVVVRNLSIPEGLAVMADGRIAVAEKGTRRLIAVDLRNGNRQTLAKNLPFELHVTLTADKVGLPAGVAVDSAGAIYVSCAGDFSIRKVQVATGG